VIAEPVINETAALVVSFQIGAQVQLREAQPAGFRRYMLNQFGAVASAALRLFYVERAQLGIQLPTADKVVGDEPRAAED
jgi:hypothetical protein